jgi:hypothetical protein
MASDDYLPPASTGIHPDHTYAGVVNISRYARLLHRREQNLCNRRWVPPERTGL